MVSLKDIASPTSFKDCRDEVVERDKIGKILEAGRNTPSPGNVQTLEFIVVEDDHKQEMLSRTLGDHRIGEAPCTIIVVADPDRMERKVGGDSEKLCDAEASAAIQNMRLMAASLGLSTVWKTGFERHPVNEQFKIPGGKTACAVLSLAYTDHEASSEPNFGMNEVCFYDEYGNQVGSFFDGIEWKGLGEEKRIYGKKTKGFFQSLRRKARQVL